jgi:hypothetical protein
VLEALLGVAVVPVPLSLQLNVYTVPATPPPKVAVSVAPGHILLVGVTVIVGSAVYVTAWLPVALHPIEDVAVTEYVLEDANVFVDVNVALVVPVDVPVPPPVPLSFQL